MALGREGAMAKCVKAGAADSAGGTRWNLGWGQRSRIKCALGARKLGSLYVCGQSWLMILPTRVHDPGALVVYFSVAGEKREELVSSQTILVMASEFRSRGWFAALRAA